MKTYFLGILPQKINSRRQALLATMHPRSTGWHLKDHVLAYSDQANVPLAVIECDSKGKDSVVASASYRFSYPVLPKEKTISTSESKWTNRVDDYYKNPPSRPREIS